MTTQADAGPFIVIDGADGPLITIAGEVFRCSPTVPRRFLVDAQSHGARRRRGRRWMARSGELYALILAAIVLPADAVRLAVAIDTLSDEQLADLVLTLAGCYRPERLVG